jgi:hypothetical protein
MIVKPLISAWVDASVHLQWHAAATVQGMRSNGSALSLHGGRGSVAVGAAPVADVSGVGVVATTTRRSVHAASDTSRPASAPPHLSPRSASTGGAGSGPRASTANAGESAPCFHRGSPSAVIPRAAVWRCVAATVAANAAQQLYRAIDGYVNANIAQWEAMEESGRQFDVSAAVSSVPLAVRGSLSYADPAGLAQQLGR